MNHYIQLEFRILSEGQKGILIALLSEAGYDGFEETEKGLKAFTGIAGFDETQVKHIASTVGAAYEKSTIEETNWNQVWESNYEPVIVEGFAAIRAGFHQPVREVEYEIVITPKMSFGTGHHATTYLMIQEMQTLELQDKSVFDFGTGTGVLAILAEKLGAREILAIDNDEWSIVNAAENIQVNGCQKITVLRLDHPANNKKFDCILANINRNVIMQFLPVLAQQISSGGCLVISGLLVEDEADLLAVAGSCRLRIQNRAEKDNWLLLNLTP